MSQQQLIFRKGSFDSMHRVVNERMKCFNIHGHTYLYELGFNCENQQEIGYTIDFKEIKRVACQWIDDILDHGAILNPTDQVMIDAANSLSSKMWLMSLNGKGQYCNPSVENISKEIFLAIRLLMKGYNGLTLTIIRLYETPNCYAETFSNSIGVFEERNFLEVRQKEIEQYKEKLGVVEYDDRKINMQKA